MRDIEIACWALMAVCTLMVLHCTVLWSPLDKLSWLLFGGSYNPQWTWWLRVIGIVMAAVGFGTAGLVFWII